MVCGVNRFIEQCDASSIIYNRCAGHVFDNAITDGLRVKEIQRSKEKVRFFCSKIHRSPKLCQELQHQSVAWQEPVI